MLIGEGDNPVFVIEVVGPAGAGKSALVRELTANHPHVISCGPSVWGLPRPDLLSSAFDCMRAGVRMTSGFAVAHRKRAMAQMVRISALARVITRKRRTASGILLVDEGPVFGLSWLEVFYPAPTVAQRRIWRRAMIRKWTGLLDGVIRIDADDATLMHRIRSRAQAHMHKGSGDREIAEFIARYRSAFDLVLSEFSDAGTIRVVNFRNDLHDLSHGAALVHAAISTMMHDAEPAHAR